MSMTRRKFMESCGYATLGFAMASALPNAARAASTQGGSASSHFDIDNVFAGFMGDIGGSSNDAGGTVTFTGKDPIVRNLPTAALWLWERCRQKASCHKLPIPQPVRVYRKELAARHDTACQKISLGAVPR